MSHKLVSLYIGEGEYYTRTDADQVIAEKDKEIERLEILCANYRHDCDNLAISNEQAKRAARTLLKKMNHNKYKRCLAMAKWCLKEYLTCNKYKITFWLKWRRRWLELAEKFKDKEEK